MFSSRVLPTMELCPEYQLVSKSSSEPLMYWIILLNTLYSCMSSRIWLPLDGKLMVKRLNKELMSPERQLVHLFVFSWMLK